MKKLYQFALAAFVCLMASLAQAQISPPVQGKVKEEKRNAIESVSVKPLLTKN